MNSDPAGNDISENESHMSDRTGIINEPLALENISFVGSEIGKGFREGYARCLLDNLVDGIIIFDEGGIIQAFNPVAEVIFSYTADEAQMEHIDKLIPKLSLTTYAQFMENGNEKDKTPDFDFGNEVTGMHKNGFAISLNLLVKKINFNGCFLFMVNIRKV